MRLFKNHPWWTWPVGLILAYAVGRLCGVPTVLWVFIAATIPEMFRGP